MCDENRKAKKRIEENRQAEKIRAQPITANQSNAEQR